MRNSWIFIFPLLIIIAMVYLVMFDNESQIKVATKLTLKQEQAIEQLGELNGDEGTIAHYMNDEEMMSAMRVVFISNCYECHGIEGTGIAGSNLCDDSYTVVKRLPDIVESISKGNIKLGMTPFEGVLSKTEIVLLASYVANLRGSSQIGKYPEGVPIDPWPTN